MPEFNLESGHIKRMLRSVSLEVGHRWERVAMDLLDMSVTTAWGNRYVLVMVDCFTRCPMSITG